jgi:hypothetical protein
VGLASLVGRSDLQVPSKIPIGRPIRARSFTLSPGETVTAVACTPTQSTAKLGNRVVLPVLIVVLGIMEPYDMSDV